MRRKGRPKKQKAAKVAKKRGRPKKIIVEDADSSNDTIKPHKPGPGRPRGTKNAKKENFGFDDPLDLADQSQSGSDAPLPDEYYSEGLHMSTMQVKALSHLVSCKDCGEAIMLGVRPTTKGMISEFTVVCKVCGSSKSTNTPNLIRERKRKREKKGVILQKNENINYAHVAAFLDNGLGYSGLRHYCKYFNARCLNEATFIVYAKQVIADAVAETEEFLQQNARIVRKAFESQLDNDFIIDLTVGYTTTYHQWGSDFCLVAGAVIELQTGLVLDYDVGNMYCHVCKINAKKIVSMTPVEMTEWFNKHQDTCEIREWCDEIDQDSEEGIKEIDPKYLEAFIAKKIWGRSVEKFGFRYTTLIHESDEKIHSELLKAAPYGDIPVLVDNITNCFSRRKSEHARTSFQNKLKSKCPRERVQTKDRIMYVYSTSIPEYNKFAIGSNIKLRELVRQMEAEEEEYSSTGINLESADILPVMNEEEMEAERQKVIEQVQEMEDNEDEIDGTLEGQEEEEEEEEDEEVEEDEEEEEAVEEKEDDDGDSEEVANAEVDKKPELSSLSSNSSDQEPQPLSAPSTSTKNSSEITKSNINSTQDKPRKRKANTLEDKSANEPEGKKISLSKDKESPLKPPIAAKVSEHLVSKPIEKPTNKANSKNSDTYAIKSIEKKQTVILKKDEDDINVKPTNPASAKKTANIASQDPKSVSDNPSTQENGLKIDSKNVKSLEKPEVTQRPFRVDFDED